MNIIIFHFVEKFWGKLFTKILNELSLIFYRNSGENFLLKKSSIDIIILLVLGEIIAKNIFNGY